MSHYPYSSALFRQHVLIEGLTGAGKTNSAFHLLSLLRGENVPFLVIEPAKTEYRQLLESELGADLLVFTPGNEMIAPFRLNPFEPAAGIYLQTHVDMLKSVFLASFNWWGPTPYVLERCIQTAYANKGWDLITGRNRRGGDAPPYPMLTDLYRTIDPVVDDLGYSDDTTKEIGAALKARVNNLRLGGKGLLLDTRTSYPMAPILGRPALFELESMGDDEEKAFFMRLLMVRLYEEHAARGADEAGPLRHVTFIEEAHRLLPDVPPTVGYEVANVRRKAIETFSNLLSEIRAYGEGIVIIEQIPSKLMRDALKNTATKIAHRTVSAEELTLMAGAMGMDDDQMQRLLTLAQGEAAVFSAGDDHPVLVQFPYRKLPDDARTKAQTDAAIRERMAAHIVAHPDVYAPLPGFMPHSPEAAAAFRHAAHAAEDAEFRELTARLILSAVLDDGAAARELPRLWQAAHTRLRHDPAPEERANLAILAAAREYFERLGDEHGLPYGEVAALTQLFLSILWRLGQGGDDDAGRAAIGQFQARYRAALRRETYPFTGCAAVCPAGGCLYRHNVRPFVGDGRLDRNYRAALANLDGEARWDKLRRLGKTVVRRAVAGDAPPAAQAQIAGCFSVQKSQAIDNIDYALRVKIHDNTIHIPVTSGGK